MPSWRASSCRFKSTSRPGIGGVDTDGSGIVGLSDRAAALGGQLTVDCPDSGGTLVAVTLPLPGGYQFEVGELLARPSEMSVYTVAEAVRPFASGPLDPRRAD